jgi:hypothetical protein
MNANLMRPACTCYAPRLLRSPFVSARVQLCGACGCYYTAPAPAPVNDVGFPLVASPARVFYVEHPATSAALVMMSLNPFD